MILPFILTIVVSIQFFSFNQTSLVDQSKNIYYNQLFDINTLLLSADRDFYQANIASTESYINRYTVTPAQLKAYAEEYATNSKQVIDRYLLVKEKISQDDYLYNTFTIDGDSRTMNVLLDEFYAAYSRWDTLYDCATGKGDYNAKTTQFGVAREYLDAMQDFMIEYATYQEGVLHQALISSIVGTVGIIFFVVIVCLIFFFFISRYISKGITEATKRMNTLAQKDLTYTGKEIKSKDEVGTLSNAAVTVQQSLTNIVTVLNASTTQLTDSAEILESSASETSDSMKNIALAVSDLTVTITQQAEDANQIASNMQDLNHMMEQSAGSTSSLDKASNEINQLTSNGKMTVETLTQATLQAKKAFENIFEVIVGIENSTKKISEASGLISSIASQTNLLSLNASIEAARAGEAGRGFAVVAEQIRDLSEQSANSVETINHMLDELQKNTNSASEQSGLVRNYVEKQNESVEATKTSFDDIISSIDKVNAEIEQLEGINKQLESGFTNILGLVDNLSDASERNAATAQELNATTEVVSNSVESLHGTGSDINQLAEELAEIIGEFKM